MSKQYRLLEAGEKIKSGDEGLSGANKWEITFTGDGNSAGYTPIRRLDDGKGKWLLVDQPAFEDVSDFPEVEFWRWGDGWLRGVCFQRPEGNTVWRKKRAEQELYVLVAPENHLLFISWEEDKCRSEAEKCALAFPDKTYRVCKLVNVAIYSTKPVTVNKVVIEEVGK